MTAAVGARNLFRVDAGVVHALLQARYYDGSKGEFLSEDSVFLGDPKQQVLADPQLKQLLVRERQSDNKQGSEWSAT
jgi:hypothetical protein